MCVCACVRACVRACCVRACVCVVVVVVRLNSRYGTFTEGRIGKTLKKKKKGHPEREWDN